MKQHQNTHRGNSFLKSCALVCLSFLLPLSSVQAGKYAAAYLNIGVGARGLGLGGAYIALSRNATAFYWNPAGLAFVQNPQMAFMYASQFGSLGSPLANYNYVGAALPLRGGATIAANWIRLSSGEIPVYPELQGDNLGQRLRDPELRPDGQPAGFFSNQENAYYFSFSKMNRFNIDWGYQTLDFPVEIPIGVNLKLLQQSAYGRSASGVGVDIGVMLRIGLEEMLNAANIGKLSFGFQLRDISRTTLTWDNQKRDEIEPSFRWGFAYEKPIPAIGGNAIFTWQNRNPFDKKVHYGAELRRHSLFLRIGSSDGNLTAGTGFSIWKLVVDYAFTGYELGNVHRLSGVLQL